MAGWRDAILALSAHPELIQRLFVWEEDEFLKDLHAEYVELGGKDGRGFFEWAAHELDSQVEGIDHG